MLLKCLKFCTDFFDRLEKQLDKKAQVSSKIYDVINFETNNDNTHISQYFNKQTQSDNEH